ncbi:MAG: hypothetical protein FD172_3787, partial [Methylocystaceae bacterium]
NRMARLGMPVSIRSTDGHVGGNCNQNSIRAPTPRAGADRDAVRQDRRGGGAASSDPDQKAWAPRVVVVRPRRRDATKNRASANPAQIIVSLR